MSITGLHLPCADTPLAVVAIDERDAMSYYPYVQGGPVEAAHLLIQGLELAVYVNSRYAQFGEDMVNFRATALFEMAGVGMFGGAVRGDGLAVLAAGGRAHEQSLPPEFISLLLAADSASSPAE